MNRTDHTTAVSARRRRAVPLHVRLFVYARDGRRCALCGATDDLHLDHVVPWSEGGPDESGNLRPLCPPCNVKRGVARTDDDLTTRPPVAARCTECSPKVEPDAWGFCFACRQFGDVSAADVDRCPGSPLCDCASPRRTAPTPITYRPGAAKPRYMPRRRWDRLRRRYERERR